MPKEKRKPETSYTVDPLSDLVSATELRVWKSHPTTRKVLRYLGRWRAQVLEYMGEGGTLAERAETTATLTVEASAKAQMLKDIIALEAKDVAAFYQLDEPQDGEKK